MNAPLEPSRVQSLIIQELDTVLESEGNLRPETVVDYARENQSSILHNYFTWDDSKAAEQFRLVQARHLLRVKVKMLVPNRDEPLNVRAFVSLAGIDRKKEGLGYRQTLEVLSSKDLKAMLLKQAKRELAQFVKKYEMLEELSEVRGAIYRILD